MTEIKSLISPREALLVLGSLNAHPQDRKLDRAEITPVQLVIDGEVRPVPFFDSWGELGVSSFAYHPRNPFVLYVTTGKDLTKVDLQQQSISSLEVANLRDVHEMTIVDDTLWIANTGSDEIVAFDVVQEKVISRVNLTIYGSDPKVNQHMEEARDGEVQVVDKFHCNQVFEGFDGELYVLVHYVSGKQFIRRVAQKLIKSQGNGGVINLNTGYVVPLGLKGPHSVRKVEDSYWVCDSGNAKINVYDPVWRLKKTLSTKGWGRGAGVSNSNGLFYSGVSETRKRYLGLVSSTSQVPNVVEIFTIEDSAQVGEIRLSSIEQVNNVYVVFREVALVLLDL